MKRLPYWILILTFVFQASCNKNEESYSIEEIPGPPPMAAANPSAQAVDEPMPPPLRDGAHDDIPDLSDARVVIPEGVKGKWKSVTLMLEDKISHEITEHTVDLGQEWSIPDSNLKVKVGTFLPDLIIQGKVFTSVSNELKNPAIHVRIVENGAELFEGWLFSLFPTMHSFQHERFSITLKDVSAS
ncbi:MAG: DUF2155 domain-containing protein [Nitrospiria bacterium]